MFLLNSVKAYRIRIEMLNKERMDALLIGDYNTANNCTRSLHKSYGKLNQLKQRLGT